LLIVVGIFIIVRPDLADFAGPVSQRFLGDIDRRGEWTVQDEAFTAFVGDVDLDMSEAHIPAGETVLKFSGFVGDVTIRVPGDVGVAVQANAVVSELRLDDEKDENFLSPTRGKSANYKLAERRLRVEASYFVCDVRVVYT
jgi:lia operon protein LiaF